jgi:hypothetical protein
MTFEEYWRIQGLVHGDVEAAVKSNHTYLAINNLALAEPEILDRFQKYADFWTFTQYALQTTFFISFGRIFDGRHDALSVQKLLALTSGNAELFSKAALLERKRKLLQGPDPDWLAEYIENAWEPSSIDLKPLKKALAPHYEKFEDIYRPIRHRYYAHRGDETKEAISELFSKTRIDEVNEILRFLHTLILALQNLAMNGTRPDLTDFRNYEGHVSMIKTRVEHFIRHQAEE